MVNDKSSQPDPQLTTIDKLRMLLDITKKISRSLDVDEVLTLVMDTLGSLIHYDAAGIYLIEYNKDDESPYIFKSKTIRGYKIPFALVEPRIRMGEGFIGYVAQTGKPIISPDVHQDSRYFHARKQTRSEMVAPIISNDKVIGVFDLESDKLNSYTDDDLQLLMLLASQVAIIIEKPSFTNRSSRKNVSKHSSKSPAKFSLNYCPNTIRKLKISTSARIFSQPKKFRATITIG